jgi:hypothetical protein
MTTTFSIAQVYHKEATHPDPVLVAIVGCDTVNHAEMLEDAFRLTNHITNDWSTNPQVMPTGLGTGRSTSVGDYIQLGLHVYRCDPTGWTHIFDIPAPTRWQIIKSFFVRLIGSI